MLDSTPYSLATILLTHLAEAYDAGAYGSGNYSQADTATDSPIASQQTSTPNTTDTSTTPQTNDAPASSNNTPTHPADMRSYQSTTQPTSPPEATPIMNGDPSWAIIVGGISITILAIVIALLVKKLLRRNL